MSEMLDKVANGWVRAWGEGDTDAFKDILADDYVRHSKSRDEHIEDVMKQIEASREAFTDFTVEIINAVEDSDMIAIHWKSVGKHTGEFMGVPPTGRTVEVSGAAFIKHRDGKIYEETTVWDPRELLSSMNILHLGTRS